MNHRGTYRHQEPENVRRRGFQWGALASPRVFSWLDIAEAQMEAGKTADPDVQADFDNSWRGLPFRPRRVRQATVDAIREHEAPLPEPGALAGVFLSADTQDNGWYWVVRGIDGAQNMFLLAHGFARSFQDIQRIWDAEYLGIQCVMGIIDEGGHQAREVQAFVQSRPGLYSYKGDSRIGTRYKASKTQSSLLLANPWHYQAELLYFLYSQTDRSNHYLFLAQDTDEEYVAQVGNLQEDKKRKHGDRYENWQPTGDDHYFDAEKMMLVLLDYARDHLPADKWRLPVQFAKRGKRRRDPRQSTVDMEV